MRLVPFIAEFNLIQTRLSYALTHPTASTTKASLMQREAALLDRIEHFDPTDRADLLAKIDFFMSRSKKEQGKGGSWRDHLIALDLINDSNAERFRASPCRSRSSLPYEILGRLVDRRALRHELTRHIVQMKQRASLIGIDFRHICTSRGNANFHKRSQSSFARLHMRDLIGSKHFESCTHGQMCRALAGESVSYEYERGVAVLGLRVMRCHMRRWFNTRGGIGGLALWDQDITDDLTTAGRFADLPQAAVNHSIDGTT